MTRIFSVTSVRWSFDGHFCISSSVDRTARIWAAGGGAGVGRSDALVVMKGEHHDVGCKLEGGGASSFGAKTARPGAAKSPVFSHAVVDAAFFYQDKYILLGMGAALQLHKYAPILPALYICNVLRRYRLPPALSGAKGLDDLQKLKKEYKYKCIHSLQSSAQSVSCIASLNEILSPTVIAAGSDKSITVFDLAHGCTSHNHQAEIPSSNSHFLAAPYARALPMRTAGQFIAWR
jgi:WD40 repeat protein